MGMAFIPGGTDAFIVDDPTDPAAWRHATHIDDGPWGDRIVTFSDQYPLAFVRDNGSFETDIYQFDPAAPTEPWTAVEADLPDTFGTFTPVQTTDGWWGMSAENWYDVSLWRAPEATGPWTRVDSFRTATRTYDHALNVIDGRVWWRWSNGEGSGRPDYWPLELDTYR